eukprot:scaffold7336_cov88-Cylindrotheca_fusiformis.AAC.2
MATDIVDKELQALRKNRWETAFSKASPPSSSSFGKHQGQDEDDDRKATTVIEHLIQASDVSHTMQHWHICKDWNERFFMECYRAYKAGRADRIQARTGTRARLAFSIPMSFRWQRSLRVAVSSGYHQMST